MLFSVCLDLTFLFKFDLCVERAVEHDEQMPEHQSYCMSCVVCSILLSQQCNSLILC